MAEPKKTAPPERSSRGYLARQFISTVIVAVAAYYIARPIVTTFLPQGPPVILWALQALVAILVSARGVYIGITKFRDLRRAELARDANAQVAKELNKLKGRTAVADISTKAVTDSLKDVKVDPAQLVRIVEQQKQQLLIDDEYFRAELRDLIVTYLCSLSPEMPNVS
jgi:hypothetical protein